MKIERLPIFGARGISLALLSSMLCLAQSTPAVVIGKFVGTWKENEAKRKIGSGLALRFRRAANGQLEELRGPEARPVAQPVNFDGKPYKLDNSKNTIVWKQQDATHFERTISENGNLITTRRIQISADGKTLTEVTERKTSDGKDLVATVVFKRSSGDQQELVGIWKPESVHTSEPGEVKYESGRNQWPAGHRPWRLYPDNDIGRQTNSGYRPGCHLGNDDCRQDRRRQNDRDDQ